MYTLCIKKDKFRKNKIIFFVLYNDFLICFEDPENHIITRFTSISSIRNSFELGKIHKINNDIDEYVEIGTFDNARELRTKFPEYLV